MMGSRRHYPSLLMQNHRKLEVYGIAKELALQVYAIAAALPATERFELACQLRVAAVSVGSNIAEGCGRSTKADFTRFLGSALGSANELEFQLELSIDAGLTSSAEGRTAAETARSAQRMLARLITRVRTSHQSPVTSHQSPVTSHQSPV